MAFTARLQLLVLVTLLFLACSRAQNNGSPPSSPITGMEGFLPCQQADRIIALGKRIGNDNKDEIFKNSRKVLRVGDNETPFERYNRAAFFYLCAKLLPGTAGPSLSLLRNEIYMSLQTARPIVPYIRRLIRDLNGYQLAKCTPKLLVAKPPIAEDGLSSCPGQYGMKHGSIQCTKSWYVQSECTFTCQDAGYSLHPPGRTTNVCNPDQQWNLPKPCCARPCPPNALMDLVMVLDSSSSVGAANWLLLTTFVEKVIRSFNVAPDAANVAFFRYNRDIDSTTEVFLNSYPSNIEGLVRALHAIKYDGTGTFTGQALNHALTSSMSRANGNRPNVKTVVLVITDGKAADDVATPSNAIRAAGAEIIVVGIEPPRGRLDMGQLRQIAGSEENLVIASGGFGRLGKSVIDKISSSICGDPCGENEKEPRVIEAPVKACPGQGEMKHGSIQCTKSWNIQSECIFTCQDAGYSLHPPGRTTNVCKPDQQWNLPKPCCTRPCPPNALMDLVMVLDSSSSVGAANWLLLTTFVEKIIRSFNVAPDSANVAFFRFNRDIDNTTEVFLNSYPSNIEGLVRALRAIPYDGRGTYTGQALNHALTSSMSRANGNRPNVKTVVLVITDGKAADDVATPSNAIRAAGAEIIVVGIKPPRGRLDMGQLRQIAGPEENLVVASGGFGRLGKRVIDKISSSICRDPCFR